MARKTLYIQTISKGKHPLQWLRDVNVRIHFEFQERLVELGKLTALRMREIISSTKNRGKGTEGALERSINSEILTSVGGVRIGIGNISVAPLYWEVINDGGYVPPTTGKLVPLGSFGGAAPDSTMSGGNWDVGTGNYTFVDLKSPKKPIEPFRYIDIAGQELNKLIELAILELDKSLKMAGK